jgi:hypothetical protein
VRRTKVWSAALNRAFFEPTHIRTRYPLTGMMTPPNLPNLPQPPPTSPASQALSQPLPTSLDLPQPLPTSPNLHHSLLGRVQRTRYEWNGYSSPPQLPHHAS